MDEWLPTPEELSAPLHKATVRKGSGCNVGDMGSTPGQEARIPRVAGQLSPVCCS